MDPSGFTRAMPSVDPGGSSGENPTKDTYQVQIIKKPSSTIENPTKYPSHVPTELSTAKPRRIRIEPPSGYPRGAPTDILIEPPSGYPRGDPITMKN